MAESAVRTAQIMCNFFAGHRAWRPAIYQQWLDFMVCLPYFTAFDHIPPHDTGRRSL